MVVQTKQFEFLITLGISTESRCHESHTKIELYSVLYKLNKATYFASRSTSFCKRGFFAAQGTDSMVMANQYMIPIVAPITGPEAVPSSPRLSWSTRPSENASERTRELERVIFFLDQGGGVHSTGVESSFK